MTWVRRSSVFLWVLVWAALGMPVKAQSELSTGQPVALTLEQAAELALRDNPAMEASESGERGAAARLDEAHAGRLPSLQFTETYTNSNNPVFVFGSLLEQGKFGPQNFAIDSLNQPGSLSNFRSALNLRLPVFNRFQMRTGIRKAEIGHESAKTITESARQTVRFDLIQAYFGAQVAAARRQVAEEAVISTEAEVKRIRDMHELGTVVASDLLAMEVQLADFRQQLIQAAGDVETAYSGLNTVLAQSVDRRPTLATPLVDRDFTLPSPEELYQQALVSRPDYQQADLETQLKKQDIRAARGQYMPDLNLFASFGQSSRDLSSGSSDYAVGASLTFNLVDFGRGARVREAVAASRAAEAQKRRAQDGIRLEIIRAYQNYRAADARVKVAAGAVDQAAEAFRIAQDRHGVGLTTITEVLRSQTALIRARMNLLGARYEKYVGYAQTLLAAGRLNDLNAFTR
jgi:outer membrane protein